MDTPPSLPASVFQSPTNRQPNPRTVRALGWLLVVLGLGLSISMAIIASSLYDTILHNNQPGSRTHWHGSPEFTRTTFELFGSVFLFGLVALSAGIYQIRTGSRSRFLIIVMFLAVAAIAYFGSKIISSPPASL